MTKRKTDPSIPPTPLPPICVFCQSIHKILSINYELPEQNSCFEAKEHPRDYAPFHKDQRIIKLTCNNFSHIKTATLGLRGGGNVTIRATPEKPRVELSNLGTLFDKE